MSQVGLEVGLELVSERFILHQEVTFIIAAQGLVIQVGRAKQHAALVIPGGFGVHEARGIPPYFSAGLDEFLADDHISRINQSYPGAV